MSLYHITKCALQQSQLGLVQETVWFEQKKYETAEAHYREICCREAVGTVY